MFWRDEPRHRPQAGKSRFQSSGQQVNRPALFLSKTKTGLEGELDERARWAKKRGRASDKTRSIVTRERARRLCFGGTSRDTARFPLSVTYGAERAMRRGLLTSEWGVEFEAASRIEPFQISGVHGRTRRESVGLLGFLTENADALPLLPEKFLEILKNLLSRRFLSGVRGRASGKSPAKAEPRRRSRIALTCAPICILRR